MVDCSLTFVCVTIGLSMMLHVSLRSDSSETFGHSCWNHMCWTCNSVNTQCCHASYWNVFVLIYTFRLKTKLDTGEKFDESVVFIFLNFIHLNTFVCYYIVGFVYMHIVSNWTIAFVIKRFSILNPIFSWI